MPLIYILELDWSVSLSIIIPVVIPDVLSVSEAGSLIFSNSNCDTVYLLAICCNKGLTSWQKKAYDKMTHGSELA